MNRVFHSVMLVAALFLSITCVSPVMSQVSAMTMATQKFEFVSIGHWTAGITKIGLWGISRAGWIAPFTSLFVH